MEQDYKEKSRLWKVLDRTYLYRDAWLTARKDKVQLPNGNIIPNYYILEYPNWVNTIAITKDRKFIFVRQYRHGIEELRYELCAGVCDKEDASPLESARRELWEETGYGNGHWSPFMVMSANPSTMNNLTYTFLATDVEPISALPLRIRKLQKTFLFICLRGKKYSICCVRIRFVSHCMRLHYGNICS